MPKQQDLDIAYLLMAKTWGERMSKAIRRKNGCLVVRGDRIISDGYNGTPSGFDNVCEFSDRDETKPEVLHAEGNALAKLMTGTESSVEATVYTTTMPCFNCAKLIIQAKINRVVYLWDYRLHDGVKLLRQADIPCTWIKMDPELLSLHSQLVMQASLSSY